MYSPALAVARFAVFLSQFGLTQGPQWNGFTQLLFRNPPWNARPNRKQKRTAPGPKKAPVPEPDWKSEKREKSACTPDRPGPWLRLLINEKQVVWD
jgi:hypothetical protein